MVETNGRIIRVDVTIELKDYFYASLDAARTSLIVACVIVVVVIAAFSYFFILIDEQAMLLKLSPLLFGVPIVAIAGQLLRIHASYRKRVSDLSESEKNVHYIFRENDDGFDVIQGKNFVHLDWESVRRVIERPKYFRFVLGK